MSHARTRDRRLDLLRGLAMVVMVVDHVGGPSPLHLLTSRGYFYTSAAELFVLLAGMSAGMLCRHAVLCGTLTRLQRRFAKRAVRLYLVVCGVTLVELPVSEMLHLPWARGIDLSQPARLIFEVVTLGQLYAFIDVLVLYALLLALAPLAARLLATNRAWMLVGGSVLLWAGYQVAPNTLNVPWFVGRHGPYLFPLAAWQVLFCAGMVGGYHRSRIAQLLDQSWRNRLLVVAGVVFVGMVVLFKHSQGAPGPASHPAPGALQPLAGHGLLFDKGSVRIGRLVASASVFSLLFAAVSLAAGRARRGLEGILLPLGKSSLLAFSLHLMALVCIGSAASLAGTDVLVPGWTSAGLQLAVVAFVWMTVQLKSRLSAAPQPLRLGRASGSP
jgi:hypothetical protein